MCGTRNSQGVKNLHERAHGAIDREPGDDSHDDRKGTHIEDEDPEDDLVDGFRNSLLGVFGLARRHPHQFGTAERKRHNYQRKKEPCDAVREEAALIEQVGERRHYVRRGRL